MNVILIPIGSSGDVHPFVGLGSALRARGHRVTVVTNGHFGPLVRREGLEFVESSSEEDFFTVLENPHIWEPEQGFRLIVQWAILKGMRRTFEIVRDLNVPGQTVVGAQATAFGARIAQEVLGVPLVTVNLQPSMFRSTRRPPSLGPLPLSSSLPPFWNRFLYWFADVKLIDPLVAPETNAFRAEFGLSPVRRLLADWWYSPQRILGLFPDWFCPLEADWPAHTVLAGFPLFDESNTKPLAPAVEEFLDKGEAPLVFTPGSAMRHGRVFFEVAVEASRRLNHRAILLTRFRDQIPDSLPEGVRWFDYVPFSRIFPRAAAIVHHGGIGTTAQALAAGVPQLIMPMAHDQPDNAARLVRLGVGRALSRRRFQGPAVARALRFLLDSADVSQCCRDYAERIRDDNPLAPSYAVFEQLISACPEVAGRP